MVTKVELPVSLERQRYTVQGIVQGVGFRPFVYGLAKELGLAGFVPNDERGVTVEVEGSSPKLETFAVALTRRAPPLAHVAHLIAEPVPLKQETGFIILASQAGKARNTLISPDVSICDDCLAELLDPNDRRFHYPFINCTNCGPRYTIIQDIPYDREETTMRVFPMCSNCRAEYDDPLDRRFHAQPNACPECGPQILLIDRSSVAERDDWQAQTEAVSTGADALLTVGELLSGGKILAIKGLGGYHLACDASNRQTVARLRERKHREAKPFALMVPDLKTARKLCRVSATEAELLRSRRRPIVLLEKLPACPVAEAVAPGVGTLGLMLPYTPLHVLLLDAFSSQSDSGKPAALVMTSGNLSDEPIAFEDGKALERLAPIVDAWLVHNRDIHIRCDDSVVQMLAGGGQVLRRSRGFVPEPLRFERSFPVPILAVGGQLKNTFCLGKDKQAFLSHHIGDLENLETLVSFKGSIGHYQKLFGIEPEVIAYDLHPDYLATKYAMESPLEVKIGVQHHHAHIASVMAEHGLEGPVIGIAADGTGYGPDGTVWGGEFLVATMSDFERAGHLDTIPLPGGERAIRQPWRIAAAYLHKTFGDDFLSLDIPFACKLEVQKWRPLARMISRELNSPLTSSLGRLFDAVAALAGVRDEVAYEGQAAIELEMLSAPIKSSYPFEVHDGSPFRLDPVPTIRGIVRDLREHVPAPVVAGRFHRTIAEMLLAGCLRVRKDTGLDEVALSGGVFQNRLLLEGLIELLETAGFRVYRNEKVPPNDGGLSLGQAAVAAAVLKSSSS